MYSTNFLHPCPYYAVHLVYTLCLIGSLNTYVLFAHVPPALTSSHSTTLSILVVNHTVEDSMNLDFQDSVYFILHINSLSIARDVHLLTSPCMCRVVFIAYFYIGVKLQAQFGEIYIFSGKKGQRKWERFHFTLTTSDLNTKMINFSLNWNFWIITTFDCASLGLKPKLSEWKSVAFFVVIKSCRKPGLVNTRFQWRPRVYELKCELF